MLSSFCLLLAPLAIAAPLHHALEVRIEPESSMVRVHDTIRLGDAPPREPGTYEFLLHADLQPVLLSRGWKLEKMETPPEVARFLADPDAGEPKVPLAGWRLRARGRPRESVRLSYEGRVLHPPESSPEAYARGFAESPGTIQPEGAWLAGSTFWVPSFGGGLVTFDLSLPDLPEGWGVVSQGARSEEILAGGGRLLRWSQPEPSEEILFVGGPFKVTEEDAGGVSISTWLRQEDLSLSRKYLDATRRYLAMYQSILPPYPYPSFALVENFWDTGYGMPGFTLLGPKVIRFPWILASSYPHEILHSWWGNSVFVDLAGGNWCEGLTTYLADHLLAEQRGEDLAYRRDTLRAWTDHVKAEKDLPLGAFRARDDAASQAVGYGKSLMLFHMARRRMGDAALLEALGEFYRAHRFKRARFEDLARALSARSGEDWDGFFEAWLRRPGAPRLEIEDVEVLSGKDGAPAQLRVRIRQAQQEDPFPIVVPVLVTLEGGRTPIVADTGWCATRTCEALVEVSGTPRRVDVDPAFEVMRRLDPLELWPSVSALRGAEGVRYVLPADAQPAEREAWTRLAEAWARPGTPEILWDRDLQALPAGPLWVLGWGNRFAGEVWGALPEQGVTVEAPGPRPRAGAGGSALILDGRRLDPSTESALFVTRAPGAPESPRAWLGAGPTAAIPGLANKVPHYGKYAALVFSGEEPSNVRKLVWASRASPLSRILGEGPVPPLVPPRRPPLAEMPSPFEASRMRTGVTVLADPSMEGRGLGSEGLERAARWVEGRFEEIGLARAGDPDRGYRQSWTWSGGPTGETWALSNLVGRIPGRDPRIEGQPVVLMAHLDHLGRGWPDVKEGFAGLVHPGADDNASGVAALLEVARVLAAEPARARPVLVVVTTGEEARCLGARHLLAGLDAGPQAQDRPMACVNLDSVGRLGEGRPLAIGAGSAREWRHILMGVQATVGVEVTPVLEPMEASDQEACIERGIPGLHLLTGAHADWHRPSDTADKVDFEGMTKVAAVAAEIVAYLADRPDPLNAMTPSGGSPPPGRPPAGGERAALGTIPDFGYTGPGVRVQGTSPGSAAEKAGILAGDIVVALGGRGVDDLRGLGDALAAHRPGERVVVEVLRGGNPKRFDVVIEKR